MMQVIGSFLADQPMESSFRVFSPPPREPLRGNMTSLLDTSFLAPGRSFATGFPSSFSTQRESLGASVDAIVASLPEPRQRAKFNVRAYKARQRDRESEYDARMA